MRTILVLGDSLSAAYQMAEEDGWVYLAQEELAGRAKFINASVSGETTAGARASLPALLARYDPDVVILEIGANDGFRGHPPLAIQQNLVAMIEMSTQSGAQVVLIEMDIPANYGAYRTAFRETYSTVAETHSVSLVPSMFQDIFEKPSLLQSDGIHPNENAQPIIRDRILAVLQELLALN